MGTLNVTRLIKKKETANYVNQLIQDIEALEKMIAADLIEKAPIRIGAEQEFCLVNENFLPAQNALTILEEINDSHFTTEIAKFNLEINLDPLELSGDCFSQLQKNTERLLKKAQEIAEKQQSKVLLTGILPTLSLDDIHLKSMTPMQRYYVLNEAITASRKQHFNIHIKGVDELNILHDSILLEACNTSFQIHLQIHPDEFVAQYNWAQAIAGPILSACCNSPLLFGKELWSETRIALFTQSVDTRTNTFTLNESPSRVSFGNKWETDSITAIFKDNVSRFKSLVTSEFKGSSLETLESGEIPKLKALNLHNGTVYKWNRVCYGVGGGKPHLRIENRYISSGPTVVDEIANSAFWIGVMVGKPKNFENIHEQMNFKDVKSNFFSAARYGLATQFNWMGKLIPAQQLICNELIPMAKKGLAKMGVNQSDINHYMNIISNRVQTKNGSQWTTKSYRNLLEIKKPVEAAQVLTAQMYLKQESGMPVAHWEAVEPQAHSSFHIKKQVKHLMSTDIYSVDEKDSLELVLHIMKWKNIHHMPVVSHDRTLIGLLTWEDVENHLEDNGNTLKSVKSLLKERIVTITSTQSENTARQLMKKHKINCLPVVKGAKLIGLITSNDLK